MQALCTALQWRSAHGMSWMTSLLLHKLNRCESLHAEAICSLLST